MADDEATAIKDRLERYLAHYDPERVADIDNLLKRYRGREGQIFRKLVKEYGPEANISTTNEAASTAHHSLAIQPNDTLSSPSRELQVEATSPRRKTHLYGSTSDFDTERNSSKRSAKVKAEEKSATQSTTFEVLKGEELASPYFAAICKKDEVKGMSGSRLTMISAR